MQHHGMPTKETAEMVNSKCMSLLLDIGKVQLTKSPVAYYLFFFQAQWHHLKITHFKGLWWPMWTCGCFIYHSFQIYSTLLNNIYAYI